MDRFRAKIYELLVEQTETGGDLVRTFVIKPAREQENSFGKIFGMFQLEKNDAVTDAFLDVIIEELRNNYYYTESGTRRTTTTELKLDELLEAALRQTNLAIASFLESEQLVINFRKLSAVVGLIHDEELHFAHLGTITPFLLYFRKQHDYRIIPIADPKTLLQEHDPLKFFAHIISGKIRSRDLVVLTTENVLDYFSMDRLKNIVGGQSADNGVHELEELLAQTKAKENFGVLVIELEKKQPPSQPLPTLQNFDYRTAAQKDSMRELIRTEYETEKLLTPSLLPELKKYFSSFQSMLQRFTRKARSGADEMVKKTVAKERDATKNFRLPTLRLPAIPLPSLPAIGQRALRNMQKIQMPIHQVARQATRRLGSANRSPQVQRLRRIIGGMLEKIKIWFLRLPRSSQITLVVGVIIAIVFLLSVIILGIQKARSARLAAFSAAIEQAESLKNEAEGSLIYRDEQQARGQLVTALALLTAAVPENDTQTERQQTLQQNILQQLTALRHVITIAEPIVIANFRNLDEQASLARLLLAHGNTLITQNTSNQALYRVDLEDRVMSGIQSSAITPGNFQVAAANADQLVFFNQSNAAFGLDAGSEALRTLQFNIPAGTQVADAAGYLNRLYLLDSASGQVLRYSRVGTGYGQPTNWITQDTSRLRGANSLAVDGSVYVLVQNAIYRYDRGLASDFDARGIDPPLEAASKIHTNPDTQFIYLLDPATQRIVVINKEGALVAQYTSPQFDNLKDLVVDEANRSMYVLNGSVIFGIPADHLTP